MNTATARVSKYLRPVPGGTVTLAACKGNRLISEAADVFNGRIDSNFVNYGANEPGADTPATPVAVLEMYDEESDFQTMFGSLTSNLDDLDLTQSQIIQFCIDYHHLLRPDGLFTFKSGDQRFVTNVRVDGRWRFVGVNRFSFGGIGFAGGPLLVVVPQIS